MRWGRTGEPLPDVGGLPCHRLTVLTLPPRPREPRETLQRRRRHAGFPQLPPNGQGLLVQVARGGDLRSCLGATPLPGQGGTGPDGGPEPLEATDRLLVALSGCR